MTDFFEIDFLAVEAKKSGDAITIRYTIGGVPKIHVVDGGFQQTGDSIVEHITTWYNNAKFIDNVVLSHSDGDHAGGLRTVLESFSVGTLWMLRPWLYAQELLPRFPTVSSVPALAKILREAYPNIAALEEIAQKKGISIAEPFQGSAIGAFTVLAPSRTRYLDLVARSECTPESDAKQPLGLLGLLLQKAAGPVMALARAAWGQEAFSPEGVSAENEMSVVQCAVLAGTKILLTADAGREALRESIAYAPAAGFALPGVDRFQVPHHGSRRNVSTDILDKILGPRLASALPVGVANFTAVISSAKEDEAHPRKAVLRAMIHRGAHTVATEGKSIQSYQNAPARPGWTSIPSLPYPQEQEET
jgi:hypothetical protein